MLDQQHCDVVLGACPEASITFKVDPKRQAILLAGGDKGSADQKRFYKRLIGVADMRFDAYLASLSAKVTGKDIGHGKKS